MNRPWASHYDPDVLLEVGAAAAPVSSLLSRAAADWPQAPALVFFGRYLTYRALEDQTARLAQALENLGLKRGRRLAVLLPNCPQLIMAYHAALRLGALVVFLNPLLSPKELDFQITNSGARHLVVLDHLLPKVADLEKRGELHRVIITRLTDYLPLHLKCLYPLKARRQGLALGFKPAPGRLSWREALKHPALATATPCGPEDVAVLQFTGGTTGVPKAAVLTHGSLMANVAQINAWMPRIRHGSERVMGLLPFCHIFGLTACLNWPMSRAAMIIVLPRFEMEMFLKAMNKHRPTVLPGVPTLFVALINDPRLPRLDLSELWLCVSGSAALPLEVRDRFESISGCRILEGYGLTEASPVTHFNPIQGMRPPGSMGMPMPGTRAKIMDQETGARELPPGEVGELVLKGPQVMQGYWQNPEETAMALRDGWLYTGDLARMDESGYFYIVERKKDMIISGGYNIYPREVEEVLYQHPQVKEAVAFGLPDAYRGEVVKVVIVPQDGRRPEVEDIQDHCRREMALYKVPKIVEFRTELPKSVVGKVLRRVLREESLKSAGLSWEG